MKKSFAAFLGTWNRYIDIESLYSALWYALIDWLIELIWFTGGLLTRWRTAVLSNANRSHWRWSSTIRYKLTIPYHHILFEKFFEIKLLHRSVVAKTPYSTTERNLKLMTAACMPSGRLKTVYVSDGRSRLVEISRDFSWLVIVTKSGSVETKIDAGTGICQPRWASPIDATDGTSIVRCYAQSSRHPQRLRDAIDSTTSDLRQDKWLRNGGSRQL